MAIVIHPNIQFSSFEDRDTFLSLVRDIAHEAKEKEPKCLAYCWTIPAEESSETPAPLRGLEVYVDEDALAEHRNGTAYKHMREVVASTGILSRPKGGIPMYSPVGGFLGRTGGLEEVSSEEYFIVVEYTPKSPDVMNTVLKDSVFCREESDHILGALCFVPRGSELESPFTVFIRVSGAASLPVVREKIQQFEVHGIQRTGWWEGQGFGFFNEL
ncbi:hypothetical protein BDV18DRAFT_159684 [Aspergillus unguis]